VAMMTTVTVDLDERSYPICVGAGILSGLGARVREIDCGSRSAVVTDPNVAALYGSPVMSSLEEARLAPIVIEIPEGEEHKGLQSVSFLYDRFLNARLDRRCPVIALGGGVVGDVAGFAAATFLRGVPFVQVPTTLLAQVDSSVGGKTGVNHPTGKNLIGAFYQPRLVWLDVRTLRTLPRRQVLAGMAEIIKYAVILSPDLFNLLEREMDRVLALDDDLLMGIVRRCCELKAMVVSKDERESDYRSILNFGHTIGHAIEKLTDYREYLHGEAIAIGMVLAARLSRVRGHCTQEVEDRVIRLIRHAGLPVEMPAELVGQHLALAIGSDKKVSADRVRFVCVEEIGRTCFDNLSGEEILRHVEDMSR
jgi:3-dehydroquinate synthase